MPAVNKSGRDDLGAKLSAKPFRRARYFVRRKALRGDKSLCPAQHLPAPALGFILKGLAPPHLASAPFLTASVQQPEEPGRALVSRLQNHMLPPSVTTLPLL